MKDNPLFSVIIPVRVETNYLRETLHHLSLQTFRSFEILVITDKISRSSNPAQKRNLGAKKAKGIYLAFLDEDSYSHRNWLKNALTQLNKSSDISAVCGPCLTPSSDNPRQQASGLVWSSFLGSGGAGYYRNRISHQRFVDDFPSVNLIVKKKDFESIGGFNTHHWPGEDTILCLDLVYKLQKKILYHPSIIVYHHRREIITNHLKQITRYALHRGNFCRIYPKTSFRIGYLIPSLFLIYVFLLPLFLLSLYPILLFIPLYLYLALLFLTFFIFLIEKYNVLISLMAIISIPITHLYYGLLFIIGFFTPKLDFKPHLLDKHHTKYLGG